MLYISIENIHGKLALHWLFFYLFCLFIYLYIFINLRRVTISMAEVGLSKDHFLSGVSDGPDRNTTVWKHLKDHLKSLGFPGLCKFHAIRCSCCL